MMTRLASLTIVFGQLLVTGALAETLPTASPPAIPQPDISKKTAYSVDQVVDGDTFVVTGRRTATGVAKLTIRLIGVDAPQAAERYGTEAAAFLTKLLAGKEVYLLLEGKKLTRDKQGRVYAYACRAPDGLFINAEIIRHGCGRMHTPFPFKYAKAFGSLERFARTSKKGLWASPAGPKPTTGKTAGGKLAIPPPDVSKKMIALNVHQVVDGDTCIVSRSATVGTAKLTIRLLGVDAPQAAEPYGTEARAFLAKLLKGRKVYLMLDNMKRVKDDNGSLYAYACRAPDGLFINAEVIRHGFGRAHTPYPFKYAEAFGSLERFARTSKKGLWAGAVANKPPTPKPTAASKWAFDAAEALRRQQAAAQELKIKTVTTLSLGRGVSMKLVLIPGGKFMMGSPGTEKYRGDDEGPQRLVTISKPFYMGATEVTQAQWTAVANTKPWSGNGPADGLEYAACLISWDKATEFCEAMSKKTGRTVRLATEAEWEYACRAGAATVYSFGDDVSKLGDYAWYKDNALGGAKTWQASWHIHRVGLKKPNAWGLYDMHGNVWEWCADWHIYTYAKAGGVLDPKGPDEPTGVSPAKYRVLRGGSWLHSARNCRAAKRRREKPGSRLTSDGFRVVVQTGSGRT